ncbi:hypothetical protein BDQ12DRAFT_677896 [Crucibulum laeve]|uniref:Uncharacterized protein n=1 Tax=Crucibulum laeve TaxID=68775 RepID=A0A5C3MBI2_9AGAR|nr:hypothetical protein BDQ12DRAFT_677896 [Crucibulum laeve]
MQIPVIGPFSVVPSNYLFTSNAHNHASSPNTPPPVFHPSSSDTPATLSVINSTKSSRPPMPTTNTVQT